MKLEIASEAFSKDERIVRMPKTQRCRRRNSRCPEQKQLRKHRGIRQLGLIPTLACAGADRIAILIVKAAPVGGV
jgi:hypothetical protein